MLGTTSLFETTTLGNTALNNRVGVAPMTRVSATPEGLVTEQMISYYTSFARGGFGLIITEGTYIDETYSQAYFNQPGIANESQLKAWSKVADAVHQKGAKIFMQLQHAGSLSQGNRFTEETIAPSRVQPTGNQLAMYGGDGPFSVPKEATKGDIKNVLSSFARAAKRAQSAGFDGVELHGANGYLLDEFLTDYTNQRSDEYGGPTKNRVRLLAEISSAVREAVGDKFTVGIRISQGKPNDHAHKWADKEQDANIIFSQLGKSGINYIHVTEYNAGNPAFDSSDTSLAAFAKKYGNVSVIANGSLGDPERASNIIDKKEADIVTLGKGALANHDWVSKVKNNEALAPFDGGKILRPDASMKDFEA